eukprot:s348_g22.t1
MLTFNDDAHLRLASDQGARYHEVACCLAPLFIERRQHLTVVGLGPFWVQNLETAHLGSFQQFQQPNHLIVRNHDKPTHPEIENLSCGRGADITIPVHNHTVRQRQQRVRPRPSALNIGQLLGDANAGGKHCGVGMAVTSEPTMQSCVTSAGCPVSAVVKFL